MNDDEVMQLISDATDDAIPFATRMATNLRIIYLAHRNVGFSRRQSFRIVLTHMMAPPPVQIPDPPPEYLEWLSRQSRLMEEQLRKDQEQ